ncbi:MAG TPA: hypothetical protein VGI45_17310 [Terracidiphilus sp.]|jgi:plastocyanin
MRGLLRFKQLIGCLALSIHVMAAQADVTTDVHLRLAFPHHSASRRLPASVVWLTPTQPTPASTWVPLQHYTLVQKNRQFTPHLLVIPVGSVVNFPNKDPFFHNVFSLFDGKRFDLGLYEAGSTKSVTFSREGVSYIFCNIHPEMSAVILTLTTNLYSVADSSGAFHVAKVPVGDYEMHIWIEGVAQPTLDRMVRRVHVATDSGDLGVVEAPGVLLKTSPHSNMYGQPYDRDLTPTY